MTIRDILRRGTDRHVQVVSTISLSRQEPLEPNEGFLGHVERQHHIRHAPLPLHPFGVFSRGLHFLFRFSPVEGQEVPSPVLVHVQLAEVTDPLRGPVGLVFLEVSLILLGVASVQ